MQGYTWSIFGSAARTSTVQSGAQTVAPGVRAIAIFVDVTAVSGSSPNMTPSIEWSHNGSDWFVADTADAITAFTAAAKRVKRFEVKGPQFRVALTITGTTPSFTCAVLARYE